MRPRGQGTGKRGTPVLRAQHGGHSACGALEGASGQDAGRGSAGPRHPPGPPQTCTHLRHKARGCSGSCSAGPSEATSARGQASSIMTAATSSRMGKSVSVMTATCGDRARSRAGLSSGLLAPPRHPPPADAAAQSLLQPPRGRLGSGCCPGRRRSAHSQHPPQAALPPSSLLSAPSSPCTQGCFHGATGRAGRTGLRPQGRRGPGDSPTPGSHRRDGGPAGREGGVQSHGPGPVDVGKAG